MVEQTIAPFAVLTRPEGQNEGLAARLGACGFDALVLPSLAIRPLHDDPAALPLPSDYDLLVFVSSNAVRLYLDLLRRRDSKPQWPQASRVAAVGEASAQSLYDAGFIPRSHILHPSLPGQQDSEALWALLRQSGHRFERVLIVRGETGREWLGQQFELSGAHVRRYPLYRREAVYWLPAQCDLLRTRLEARRAPVCVLTSGESVEALRLNIERNGLYQFWERTRFVAIHERVASRLQSVLAGSAGKASVPVVKICSPNDDAIFHTIVSTATL